MVKSCCAVGCRNTYNKGNGIKFYRFPANPEKRARWVAAVNRKDWIPKDYSWICSQHFVTGERSKLQTLFQRFLNTWTLRQREN